MTLLKSIYISTFMTVATILAITAAQEIGHGGNWRSWAGLLLATAPFVAFIYWIMLTRSVARTSPRFPLISALGAAGIALSAWGYFKDGNSVPLILSVAAVAAFQAYNFWYSDFGRKPSSALKTGEILPNVSFTNTQGDVVAVDQLKGKPTIWVFIRGNWCPLCMAQVKELAAEYEGLDAAGVRVALISPQPQGHTQTLAKRLGVNFEFLIDSDLSSSRALGVFIANGLPLGMQVLGYQSDTVMPTVVITDAENRIVWAHETDNYRVRPEPEIFVEVLRSKGLFAPV